MKKDTKLPVGLLEDTTDIPIKSIKTPNAKKTTDWRGKIGNCTAITVFSSALLSLMYFYHYLHENIYYKNHWVEVAIDLAFYPILVGILCGYYKLYGKK
ncbi:MAG: hypothetical protein CBB68_05095 [Rhodospirillaceae bacterium TMED8]|nr:hypothetical protein [Magnetovibrio sp.]OUT51702.1 MAG: hypothetical protein CBB68_05095 [Rhodospirillaceae bacterium TMED8]|tara:strand:- start:764 stop:1060 length:297 start_codon:yes stop_codon:yes gene_type:complete